MYKEYKFVEYSLSLSLSIASFFANRSNFVDNEKNKLGSNRCTLVKS